MIFIVDSGSTKCDWIAIDKKGNKLFEKVRTRGLNPEILKPHELRERLEENETLMEYRDKVEQIFFYGAGCGTERPTLELATVLRNFFTNAVVKVEEDTMAAIYSTINDNEPAVVCILGTGSNCTYYDGKKAVQRVISLGYILMDDASGNYYGKRLIRDYKFHHMPEDLRIAFKDKFDVDSDVIKFNIYDRPNPNAYLAKFAEFMFLYKENPYIHELIKSGIREFTENYIFQFKDELKKAPVHFAGSIAYLSQDEIHEVAAEMGFTVGNFVRRPIDGVVAYHIRNLA
ncbi:MAG: N-acetylglucosamine kinase [Flavobacteriaceae bacterium]|nr:N-acetylglucosamine kinase [Flavobacteriaceae bacterium]